MGPQLDGAGTAKMETLDRSLSVMQQVHGIVEQMALAERNQNPIAPMTSRLRRTASPLVGLLRGQFGTISDQVAQMILAATRGASERARIRALREHVGSIRMHIEVAQKRVSEIHAKDDQQIPSSPQ